MKLDQCLLRENNNYDILRLIAASMVIVGHAHALVPKGLSTQDFVFNALHFDYAGSLAVKFFFILSGLVVTNSLVRKPHFVAFVVARAFRILPGLLACLLFSALVLGPLVTALPLAEYAANRETLSYVTKNFVGISTTSLYLQWELPGVFGSNPMHAVNGSLWTLPFEVRCYAFLFALGLVAVVKSRLAGTLAMMFIIYSAIALPQYFPALGFAGPGDAVLLPACFAFGALLAINQDKIEISARVLLGLLLLSYLCKDTPAFQYCFYVSAFYGSLVVASSSFVRAIRLPGDFSYGVYIYGFPVQQMLVSMQPQWGFHVNQALALTGAVALAACSWFLIEKPGIGFGRKLVKRLEQTKRW